MANQNLRLQRRISKLEDKDRKINLVRTILFSLGSFLIGLAVFDVQHQIMIVLAAVVFTVFGVVVRIHNRVRRTLSLFRARKQVETRQLAISNLNWKDIPATDSPELELSHRPDLAYMTDLNILGDQSLFRLVNQSVSKGGAEALLGLFLSEGVSETEIRRRTTLVQELKALRQMRYSFLTRIRLLDPKNDIKIDGSRLSAIFNESLSSLKSNFQVIVILLAQAAMLGCFFYASANKGNPLFIIPVLIVLLENGRLRNLINTRGAYAWSLSADVSLETFRSAVEVLEKYSGTGKPGLAALLSPFKGEHAASKRLRQLDQVSGALGIRQNFIVHGFVHLLLPWDILWTLRLDYLRKKIQQDLTAWNAALSEFEAFLSLAMFAEHLKSANWAELLPAGGVVLDAQELRHPMIKASKAVGNPIRLDETEKCVLLTGSNMSGKSTFLRSVGVNLALAKAGAPVAARSFKFQNQSLLTSLSGADSLQEGLSSFYAEVVRLSAILKFAQSGKPLLFLVDEIYRGTNNRERLLGSRAFIQAIVATGAKGLISSHDLELSQLEDLGIGITNYHFRESIEGGVMSFSFKKERGPCPTTNALEVMKANGLPIS